MSVRVSMLPLCSVVGMQEFSFERVKKPSAYTRSIESILPKQHDIVGKSNESNET